MSINRSYNQITNIKLANGSVSDTLLSPLAITSPSTGDFMPFLRLTALKTALASVELPPNATTLKINNSLLIDDGPNNLTLTVTGGNATIASDVNQVFSATGQTIINNTNKLTYIGDGASNGSEIQTAGYNGVESVINPRTWFGLAVPNDQEGQVYSSGLEMIARRWRYSHTWGSEWYSFAPSNNDLVAFRMVESSGLSMNMAVQRIEYGGTGPVQVNVVGATIARLYSTPFGARCPIRVQATGYTGRTPGGNGKWLVKLKVWGYGPAPGYTPLHSQIICTYLVAPAGSNIDYMPQIATSTFGGVGDQGRGWSYDKGNIPMA